ncbi:hypothetical protein MHW47_10705 [Streptomyces sp. OfavH-34-F]|uniref:hypothetical protein n=1 Tax=Streptomyces sp. OfavH-34-F TaxID=2917760 RepID=UPI001EF1A62B|nr:hypothetical protein [Streptomyces sp. OfavH-34-F]MCG7524903.1 hypothetical protein [Streptomyces sp. OfavH-34-F]
MTRLSRRLYPTSVTAIAGGAAVGLAGVLLESFPVWRIGILLAVVALPSLGYALIYRAAQASNAQLAAEHTAGYQLALYHVSLGLLDAPAAPPDGGEGVGQADTRGLAIVRTLPDSARAICPRDGKDTTHTRKAV